MKIVICGHRGVGKTALLKRIGAQESLSLFDFFDLDACIEQKTQKSVSELFQSHGESHFRQLEIETFKSIPSIRPAVIAVGGGFDVSQLPANDILVFVQRETDSAGRIFLNRPRLISGLAALDESKALFQSRQERFLKRADFIYPMLEGMEVAGQRLLQLEQNLFKQLFSFLRGEQLPHPVVNSTIVTMEPEIFERPWRLRIFFHWARTLGFRIELRDDLLTFLQIEEVRQQISSAQLIYSFRRSASSDLPLSEFALVDWALELGEIPEKLKKLPGLVVSCHEEDPEKNQQNLKAKAPAGAILKSSPQVTQFSQLNVEQNQKNNFLPRSRDGRWKWFRLFTASLQNLNYYRYWKGSSPDQASLFEMLAFAKSQSNFAAVLGDPIQFSYSPVVHDEFFNLHGTSLLPIQVREEEWSEAFSLLRKLGLRYAAVTAPLKKQLAEEPLEKSTLVQDLKAANTLFGSRCDNTDLVGFQALVEGINISQCVVWGGGGTLEMIRRVLPQAKYVSVRGEVDSQLRPQVVIWAAPRKDPMIFPPEAWAPKTVIDLNYSSHSAGIEYAQKVQARYISGLKMFIRQAQEQQLLWSQS